jgi:Ca2+-binding RTX toxin-like protein
MPSFQRLLAACSATIAATLTATAAFAPPAHAAAAGKAAVSGRTIVFTAAAGARNTVLISRSGRTVTIDDRFAIKAGSGCKAVRGDKTKVKCTTTKNPTMLRAVLGDKDDYLNNLTAIATTVGGGDGSDHIYGGSAIDLLDGGPGDDSLNGGNDDDYLVGGAGKDNLAGWVGNDTLSGGPSNDYLTGGAGDDELFGAAGSDTLDGGAGHDVLDGEADADSVIGGSGDDILDGGTGRDRLLGDSGDDTLTTQPVDRIPDPDVRPEHADGGAGGSDFCDVLSADAVVNCEMVTELDNPLLSRQFADLG